MNLRSLVLIFQDHDVAGAAALSGKQRFATMLMSVVLYFHVLLACCAYIRGRVVFQCYNLEMNHRITSLCFLSPFEFPSHALSRPSRKCIQCVLSATLLQEEGSGDYLNVFTGGIRERVLRFKS